MTRIRRVLCAIDLTKASAGAFDRALAIARASGARLYLLHVVPASRPFSWQEEERLALVTRLRARAKQAGVPMRTVEQHGDPAGTIVLHANARRADLVVLGSHRRRGWRRLRDGSVGEAVLRRADWPVLIVPFDIPAGGSSARRRAAS